MNLVPFCDPAIAGQLLKSIGALAERVGPTKLMEVCGTHTMEIGRLGLRALLPRTVELVSGPGCPVCVTPGSVIDAAADIAVKERVTVLTFGDMIRVPGSRTSLERAAAEGGSVEEVLSAIQAVRMAAAAPTTRFVFVAVGFETTVPSIARAVTMAHEQNLRNIHFLASHRLVPPALDALVGEPDIGIRGFILPGHVSAVIGEAAYAALSKAGVPGVITGFEPLDILSGIQAALEQLSNGTAEVVNAYRRVVRPEGNPMARELMGRVFEPVDAMWRGIGVIPRSGLALREQFQGFDACAEYRVRIDTEEMPGGCSCGDVLRGVVRPDQCPLFGSTCTPETPVGPCMVSSEGSCAAYYRYEVPRT